MPRLALRYFRREPESPGGPAEKGVDILTATPGRLNDLIGQGYIDLKNVEIFVLDEADRMLDMGFMHDVKRVLACLPGQKQTLLFSATMPREIEELADGLLHGPEKVMVAPPATTVERIEQSVYFVVKGQQAPPAGAADAKTGGDQRAGVHPHQT